MRMRKQQFRIGELAKCLNVERFVIRFWEKQFDLKSDRSSGKQRYYDERDLNRFKKIKELLYQRGFTIAGAKQQLQKSNPTEEKRCCPLPIQAATVIPDDASKKEITLLKATVKKQKEQFMSEIQSIRKKLLAMHSE